MMPFSHLPCQCHNATPEILHDNNKQNLVSLNLRRPPHVQYLQRLRTSGAVGDSAAEAVAAEIPDMGHGKEHIVVTRPYTLHRALCYSNITATKLWFALT